MELVDCYQLREDGAKLSPEAIKARGPVRGFLEVRRRANRSVYPGAQEREPWLTDAAVLERPESSAPSLLWISKVVEVKRTDAGVLLYGRESYGNPYEHNSHPQAWWCVFVPE